MMMDIFSSFDPYTLYPFQAFPSSWLSCIIILFPLMSSNFWMNNSSLTTLFTPMMSIMNQQANRSLMFNIKMSSWVMIPLFSCILSFNLMGLIPYSFSMSNHLFFTLTFGLPLWLSLFISSFSYKFYQGVAMLLPPGAPSALNPALVLVETVSTLVRPLTLSFRLAANMTAGHIILGLMGSYLSSIILSSPSSSILMMTIMSGYIMFEFAICLIQAYVFCLLLSLYADDHTS